jgi:hypothetical protein
MFEQVSVRHPDLITHAATVSAIGDQVTTAAQAGRAVRPGPDAYGKLCLMVPAMLGALQDVLVSGIDSAADSLRETSVRLRTTAQSYEATDQRRAEVFDAIRSAG